MASVATKRHKKQKDKAKPRRAEFYLWWKTAIRLTIVAVKSNAEGYLTYLCVNENFWIASRKARKELGSTIFRTLLFHEGFVLDRVTGSHHIFKKAGVTFVIPVHANRVKSVYVRRVIALIEESKGKTN